MVPPSRWRSGSKTVPPHTPIVADIAVVTTSVRIVERNAVIDGKIRMGKAIPRLIGKHGTDASARMQIIGTDEQSVQLEFVPGTAVEHFDTYRLASESQQRVRRPVNRTPDPHEREPIAQSRSCHATAAIPGESIRTIELARIFRWKQNVTAR